MGRMRSSWPTLACPSGDGSRFWSHEWEKHGTCSASVLDQHSYFQTALDLKKRVNLLKLLQDAGTYHKLVASSKGWHARRHGACCMLLQVFDQTAAFTAWGTYLAPSEMPSATLPESSATPMNSGTGNCIRSTCVWILRGRSSSGVLSTLRVSALPESSSLRFEMSTYMYLIINIISAQSYFKNPINICQNK